MLPEIGNILAVLAKKQNHNYCYAPFGRSAVMIAKTSSKSTCTRFLAFAHETALVEARTRPVQTTARPADLIVCQTIASHISMLIRCSKPKSMAAP